MRLPYLPVCNAHPCIIRTPILGLYFQKKKTRQKNSGSGYEKIV